jgi:hypothetical protein
MFIIAGVSPRKKVIDRIAQPCPRCGAHQAYTVRMDHYFNLFFLPIFRVKEGESFLWCENCNGPVIESVWEKESQDGGSDQTCRFCGGTLMEDFNFCPYCGKRK